MSSLIQNVLLPDHIPPHYHTSDNICMFCLYTTPSVSIFSHQLCQCPCTASHWASLTQIQGPTRAREIGGNPHWDSSHILLESDVTHLLPCWLPVFLTLWMPACCTNSGFLCLFNPGGIPHPTLKARKASLAHGADLPPARRPFRDAGCRLQIRRASAVNSASAELHIQT